MKATPKKSKAKKSLLQKYAEQAASMDNYLNAVPEITDEEAKKAIFPEVSIPIGKNRCLRVCDSAPGAVKFECSEYNGPVPLGFNQTLPTQLPLKGIAGKFLKHFAARNFFLGDQVNGWFLQNCFIYKACNMPGEDAVSCGYEIVPCGTKNKKLAEDMKIKFETEDFNLSETMRMFECYKRGFGGAIAIPCFAERDVDMENPLIDISILKGKTFLGWTILEPYLVSPEIEPGSRELTDPTYKYYMCPTHWNVYGGEKAIRIHRSWCFFRRNMFTAKIYQPMYKYLGPSVPQMVLERLYSAEVCANESSMLLRSKRTFVIEHDVRKMAANPAYAEKFLKNCQYNGDNWGTRVVPRNSNAKQMDTYLTECMSLTTSQYGILCAEVDIPAPKFMMAQLTGFANSGNYEIKLYSENIRKIHKNDLEYFVGLTAKIEHACATGKNLQFTAKFGEIDIPTVVEKADIMYETARAMKFYEESQAIKRGEKAANNHKAVLEK